MRAHYFKIEKIKITDAWEERDVDDSAFGAAEL
jgi:hypothetical protein